MCEYYAPRKQCLHLCADLSASCLSVAFGLHTHEKNSTCSGGSETRGDAGSRVGPPPWTPPACRSPLCEHAERGGGGGSSTAEELEPSRSSQLARARYFWRARGTRQRRRRVRGELWVHLPTNLWVRVRGAVWVHLRGALLRLLGARVDAVGLSEAGPQGLRERQ